MKADDDPIYRRLPRRPLVETVTPIVLLTETDSQSADHAEEIFQGSVQGRPILLSSEEFRRTQRRDQRQSAVRRKVKPKPLNAHQRRSLGIYEIPKHQRHYALYVPLHTLWKEYMSELCANLYDPNVIGEKLLKADFHGCDMSITRSSCPSRVGLSGICVKETRGTFTLITPSDELKGTSCH